MPRKATIIVNDSDVLAAITDAYRADCEALDAEIAAAQAEYDAGTTDRSKTYTRLWWLRKDREVLADVGLPYDLARFAGRELTPTERVYWQRSIRRLEAAGKVVRYCNNIRPVLEVPVDG
jgi:hypothetical protein